MDPRMLNHVSLGWSHLKFSTSVIVSIYSTSVERHLPIFRDKKESPSIRHVETLDDLCEERVIRDLVENRPLSHISPSHGDYSLPDSCSEMPSGHPSSLTPSILSMISPQSSQA